MKDSLDILCTNYEVNEETPNEIETVYHDSLNILRTDVICHHGILGMKWGIRRYQNKDGSLTAAGKKRYYGSVEGYENGWAWNGGNLTKKGEKAFKNRKGEWKNTPAAQKAKEHEESNKVLKEARDAKRAIGVEYVKSELNPALSKMNGLKSLYDLQRTDTASIAEWKSAARLGLRALESTNDLGFRGPEDKGKPFDNSDMTWFLFEDQTIGMPQVAAMINRGFKGKQIKEMMTRIEDVSPYDLPEEGLSNFTKDFVFGTREGGNLSNFIDSCEKVKDYESYWEKKIK
jgi:hypothetical protein